MKISNDKRKTLRLLCFLLSALLVMTVSAAVYNYMYMQATSIGAEEAKVKFEAGSDPAGAQVGTNGTYVNINSMAGWPNATRIYEDAVRIRNMEATGRTIELKYVSWSGSITNIDYIYVKVFNAVPTGGNQQGSTLSVTAGNSTGTFTLSASALWRVQWEIKWKAGALSTNTVSVTLQLVATGE